MDTDNHHFYAILPKVTDVLDVADLKNLKPLPDDWLVAVADVKGSTQAIEAGRYKEVNSLGVSVIAAVINALKPVEIPYVFGGDGATFCVPLACRPALVRALLSAQNLARQEFDLELRIGIVPVQTLYEHGSEILVGRYKVSEYYDQAVFMGGGLDYAESLIKADAPENAYQLKSDESERSADFSGLECRWENVKSPHGETVAFLFKSCSGSKERDAQNYQKILKAIGFTYGDVHQHHPITLPHLELSLKNENLAVEHKTRCFGKNGLRRFFYAVALRSQVLMGRLVMRLGLNFAGVNWSYYKKDLVANCDFRKLDDCYRAILAGTSEQREQLEAFIDAEFDPAELFYGCHVSSSALITCIISEYEHDHFHFVDAADGGYAMAAKQMKAKMQAGA